MGGIGSMEPAAIGTQSEIEKLEQEREETTRNLERQLTDLRNMAEPTADEADVDAYEREKTWALAQSLQRKLESIERALRLAQAGTYGICESCGERIDPARLEILPQTTLCLACQRKLERQAKRAAR